MEPVTLNTARLELSPPTADDTGAIFAACQDADIQRYTTVPSPYARAHAEGFIAHVASGWSTGSDGTWAIRAEGALVGMLGLHGIEKGQAEIGYWMAPTGRGKGMLSEAARAAIEWGFSDEGLGLIRLQWHAVVGNIPSARTAQALGFRFEGVRRQAFLNGAGARSDAWIAGLLNSDDRAPQPWAALNA